MRSLIPAIILFLCSATACFGQEPIQLNSSSNGIDISQASYYTCINENIDNLQEIENSTFIPWKGPLINFGYTTQYCWIKFKLLNNTAHNETYYLTTRFSFVDYLDIYFQQNGEEIHIPLGDQHPLNERSYIISRQIGKINLSANEKLTVYIKAHTNATLIVPVSLFAEKPFIESLSYFEWQDGIFYGILLGLLVLSTFLYWHFRDPTYASYFFHVIFMMLLLINMDGKTIFLFKNSPEMIDYCHMVFTSLTMITAVIFARYYLNLVEYKKLNLLGNFNIAIGVIYLLLIPVLPIQISNMITSILSMVVASSLLIAGVVQLKRGLNEAIYYCIGWSILLFGTITISSSIIGSRLALDEIFIAIKFSFVAQQIILCFGLSQKIKMLQKKEELSKDTALRHQLELETRNEFFAKMSHEIRTPINGVLGCLQLIDKTQLNKEQLDYINTASNSADILLCIINDILDLSKIEAGKLKLENKAFDLRNLINETIQVFELEKTNKNVKFIKEVSNDVPRFIVSDSIRIHQILLNLLSNAVKFTNEGSITIKVNLLSIDNDNCTLQFKVIDTGIGMEENEKEILFQPFQQAGQSNKAQLRGTGLGLSICRQICELMQGDISVESHLNVGTTFTFTIKAKVTTDHKSLQSAAEIQGKPLTDINLQGLTILFAEDNPINAKVLEGTLTKLKADFIATSNGLKALETYKASPKKFDLIIMDCEMPEMDGYSASMKIRQFEKIHGIEPIPIIALTAHATEETAENCLAVGMNTHISKPVKISELTSKILEIMDKKPSSISSNIIELKRQ